MNIVEESTVIFRLDGKPFISSLSEIEMKLVEAKDKMALLEKGTKEWSDARKDVKDLEVAIKDARSQMDLSQLTVKQLTDLQRDMVKVMKESKVGSEEYVAAAKKLEEVNPILAGVRRDMRGIGEEATGMGKIWGQFKEDFTRAFSVVSVFEAGRAVATFVQDSVIEFRKFQSAGADLSAVTGLVGKDLQFLKDQANITGPAVGMMGSDMLNAYKMMASAKPELLNQKELLAETTARAITLAQAAKIDLAPAVDLLAGSLNQFGRPAQDSAKFINIIAAGAKEGSAEIADMATALKNSGTVAAASKVSFEQTNAVLQSLSTISLKGGEAGTQLRNVLLTLAAGSDETNPKVVGLDKAIENLGKQKLSTAEIAKLFGKENVVAAQHIISHGKEIKELTTKLTGTNEAFTQASKNTATLDFQMKQAAATTATLKTEIGSRLEPILVKSIATFITFVNVIRGLPAFIKENKDMIIALGVALLAFNGHLIVATASSLAHAAGERTATIAKAASASAQLYLNAALTANPIGAVVAAIAILVGGLVTWYNNSETVRAVVNGLWEAIKVGIGYIGKLIDMVVNFVKESSFIQGVVSLVSEQVKFLMERLNEGFEYLTKVFDKVKKGMEPLYKMIDDIINLAKKAISIFTGLISSIDTNTFSGAGAKIGKAFSDGYANEMKKGRAIQENEEKTANSKSVAEAKKI
ncbi:MAG: phage tail tape measure protein, partial [Sediminibacterium sp.]|nr:phage tail tape measure protein [Sediminibacterium sp.]